jgi:hypothetical protein
MENNENFVAEQVTENVEQTTEETPKMFTQDEVNEIVGKSKARERAKVTKQFERKYGRLEEVLKTGTGKEDVGEITDTFRGFYEQKGIQFKKKNDYSAEDIEILARAEADNIIRAGYEDVVEEVERLSEVGFENLTAREKAVFHTLAEYRQKTERGRELSSIGVTEDVYESEEFKSFAKQFNSNTPIKDVFDIYRKTQPQKEIRTMGSMKSTPASDSGVKEFYTVEEARKFTKADYDKNPDLFAAVERSMQKWK